MRRIKDGAGIDERQPGCRGIPISRWRASRGAATVSRGFGLLILLGLLAVPTSAEERAGDREGSAQDGGDGAPLLLMRETEIDLGQLPKGSSAEARFELRNAGNADLRVLEVRSGCACTVAKYDEVIPPGGVGYVTATILTETLTGPVGQGVSVLTNDPTSPVTSLLVRAEVVFAVRVLPEKPIVLRSQAGELPVRRVIRRSANSGHGFFGIAGLRTSAPWIDARARKVREPEPASGGLPAVTPGDWILEVRLDGQPMYGKRHEVIEFKTGLERQPHVKLDVHADILPPVLLPVDRLFLQARGEAAAETLSFTVREGLDPSAVRASASPEGLTVQLEPGDGPAMTARVRWMGGRLDEGQLVFRIAGERIEVPVLFQPSR